MLKVKISKLLMILSALVLSTDAYSAATVDRDKYVFASVSFIEPDGARGGKAGDGVGLGLTLPAGELWSFDFRFDKSGVGVSGKSVDFKLEAAVADLRYNFGSYRMFHHYWVVGVGVQQTSINKLQGSTMLYNGGVGTQYLLHNDMYLRLDVRYRRDEFNQWNNNNGYGDIVVSLSLDIPLQLK